MDWDSGIFMFSVMLAVPLLIAWTKKLGTRNSADGTTFRPAPPLRALYPGMSIATILAEFFYAKDLWEVKRPPGVIDCFAMALMFAIFLICVVTWPPTLFATAEGLRWHRLFSRRFIVWDQIESAYSGGENDLVIFVRGGQRYEVSRYVQGRAQLKALIKKRLTALHGSDVCVR